MDMLSLIYWIGFAYWGTITMFGVMSLPLTQTEKSAAIVAGYILWPIVLIKSL